MAISFLPPIVLMDRPIHVSLGGVTTVTNIIKTTRFNHTTSTRLNHEENDNNFLQAQNLYNRVPDWVSSAT